MAVEIATTINKQNGSYLDSRRYRIVSKSFDNPWKPLPLCCNLSPPPPPPPPLPFTFTFSANFLSKLRIEFSKKKKKKAKALKSKKKGRVWIWLVGYGGAIGGNRAIGGDVAEPSEEAEGGAVRGPESRPGSVGSGYRRFDHESG